MLGSVVAEEGRVCLDWPAPSNDLLGRPVAIGGYFVYRRMLPQEEYERPLNAAAVADTSLRGHCGQPYGAAYFYTVRATALAKPRIEGPPADEAGILYRDVYPPAAPARLDALSEAKLVRLVWDPVGVGRPRRLSRVRAEDEGPPAALTEKPITDTFFTDETVPEGKRYRYTVRAVDRPGNLSAALARGRRRAVLTRAAAPVNSRPCSRRASPRWPAAETTSSSSRPTGGSSSAEDRARLALVCRRGTVGRRGRRALPVAVGTGSPAARLLQLRRRARVLLRQRDALRRPLRRDARARRGRGARDRDGLGRDPGARRQGERHASSSGAAAVRGSRSRSPARVFRRRRTPMYVGVPHLVVFVGAISRRSRSIGWRRRCAGTRTCPTAPT